MPQISENTLVWIGTGVISLIGIALSWGFENLKKSVNKQMDKRDREDREFRKEQEETQIHEMKGQQIMCDCLHEIMYAVIHGEHNGGIETVANELEKYRSENRDVLLKKAARWNLRIDD